MSSKPDLPGIREIITEAEVWAREGFPVSAARYVTEHSIREKIAVSIIARFARILGPSESDDQTLH